jgi:hypothetical protein
MNIRKPHPRNPATASPKTTDFWIVLLRKWYARCAEAIRTITLPACNLGVSGVELFYNR